MQELRRAREAGEEVFLRSDQRRNATASGGNLLRRFIPFTLRDRLSARHDEHRHES